jgi:hypothetical protein
MTDFKQLLRALVDGGVEFILVGGLAAAAHGSSRDTRDLDIVYRRTSQNIGRLAGALLPLCPYLRGAPPGLPFQWDPRTIERGLNFTLTTTAGAIDALGEIVGGGGFEQLLPHTVQIEVLGMKCLCLNLDKLIHVKRAAGRPKDLEAIAELEMLRDEPG